MFYFVLLLKQRMKKYIRIPNVHTNKALSCSHRQNKNKTTKKESLQQLILCPLMLRLRRSGVNIREVNSQRNLQLSSGALCSWGWSKSLDGRGSSSCQEAKPHFSTLTAKTDERIPLVLSNSHPGSLVWSGEAPKNPQWKVLCSGSI